METKIVRLDYANNPATTAQLEEHKKVIEEKAAEGYRYSGFVPVKMGPSGKILSVDLIFQK